MSDGLSVESATGGAVQGPWTDIEKLAVEHEAFGFGRIGDDGLSTHGFDPDGLQAFVTAIRRAAREEMREEAARFCATTGVPGDVADGNHDESFIRGCEYCATMIRALPCD